jgi:hypothetical protein
MLGLGSFARRHRYRSRGEESNRKTCVPARQPRSRPNPTYHILSFPHEAGQSARVFTKRGPYVERPGRGIVVGLASGESSRLLGFRGSPWERQCRSTLCCWAWFVGFLVWPWLSSSIVLYSQVYPTSSENTEDPMPLTFLANHPCKLLDLLDQTREWTNKQVRRGSSSRTATRRREAKPAGAGIIR